MSSNTISILTQVLLRIESLLEKTGTKGKCFSFRPPFVERLSKKTCFDHFDLFCKTIKTALSQLTPTIALNANMTKSGYLFALQSNSARKAL